MRILLSMTRAEVLAELDLRLMEFESHKTAAKKWHLSPQYLSDVLNGRRAPGQKLLRALKLRRVEAYECIS